MKKRGFAMGKWNGSGGKVEPGESIEEAAVRELSEEIGVKVRHDEIEKVGNIQFHFNDQKDWNQHVHIFFVRRWEGEPQESEEMRPQWFAQDEIPYKYMWIDEAIWLPKVLGGKKIEGKCYFNKSGDEIDVFELKELET